MKDESQKIREANFIQELEMDIKRVETVKKIAKYHQQTEKHASTLEEQNKLKMREIEQKERAVIERKRKLESERQNWVEGLNRRRDERLQGRDCHYRGIDFLVVSKFILPGANRLFWKLVDNT